MCDLNLLNLPCSPLWMAPEMIQVKHYDEKVDVYSYGICLWELYSRRVPYRELDLSPHQLVAKAGGGDQWL